MGDLHIRGRPGVRATVPSADLWAPVRCSQVPEMEIPIMTLSNGQRAGRSRVAALARAAAVLWVPVRCLQMSKAEIGAKTLWNGGRAGRCAVCGAGAGGGGAGGPVGAGALLADRENGKFVQRPYGRGGAGRCAVRRRWRGRRTWARARCSLYRAKWKFVQRPYGTRGGQGGVRFAALARAAAVPADLWVPVRCWRIAKTEIRAKTLWNGGRAARRAVRGAGAARSVAVLADLWVPARCSRIAKMEIRAKTLWNARRAGRCAVRGAGAVGGGAGGPVGAGAVLADRENGNWCKDPMEREAVVGGGGPVRLGRPSPSTLRVSTPGSNARGHALVSLFAVQARGRRRVWLSVEEPRGTEIRQLGPLLSAHHLVGDRGAQEGRHRHATMGDREIVAADPRHRPDSGEMIAGDWPDGDADRLGLDLADRGQQRRTRCTRSRACGIAGLSLLSRLTVASVAFQCSISRPAPSGRASMMLVRTRRPRPAATGGVNTRKPTVGASGRCRPASRTASLVQRPAQFTTMSASCSAPSAVLLP